MKAVRTVLLRAIVKEFYKANSGFFLVVLGLGFGFLKTAQHVDLASVLAFKPVFYLIPFGLWLLYTTKTVIFLFTIKRLPENTWLTYLDLLSPSQRRAVVLYVQALLLAPILAYGGFLAYQAFQLEQWFSVIIVIAGNMVLLALSTFIIDRKLVSPTDPKVQNSLSSWTGWLPKTFPMLFIHQLFNRQAFLLFGIKAASMIIVIGAIQIYEMESVDLRLLSLGFLLSAAVNAVLCFHYHEFIQQRLLLFANLPISSKRKFIDFGITYFILMLPELLILFGNLGSSVAIVFLLKAALLPYSLLVFYHYLFYWKRLVMEGFTQYIFFGTAILFFVILAHVDLTVIAAVLLGFSYLTSVFKQNQTTV
jgi:hypothetical protein